MQVFFKSRDAARNSIKNAKLVDHGKDAPAGKRYARDISTIKKQSKSN